jgi:hypothetical protein
MTHEQRVRCVEVKRARSNLHCDDNRRPTTDSNITIGTDTVSQGQGPTIHTSCIACLSIQQIIPVVDDSLAAPAIDILSCIRYLFKQDQTLTNSIVTRADAYSTTFTGSGHFIHQLGNR